jgi:hypothetical protein
MRVRVALFIALLTVVTAASRASADNVWSGLVMAENSDKPHPPPAQIASLEKTLVELFGYNQFDIIGESNKALNTGQEDWLASSKYFSLHVDARGVNDNGYELNLKLFQDKQLLLETETKLSRQSPLVIKGPQVGGGQLLLVLMAEDVSEKKDGEDAQHRRHRGRETNSAVNAWRRLSRFVRNALP